MGDPHIVVVTILCGASGLLLVIFFNETGEKATRADMAGATPSVAGATIRAIATTDWDCRVYGDVAVTSFIDVLEQGKPGEVKFRSVETWRKEAAAWKMIGSETLTLQQDPDFVALDGKALDEYAGSYEAGPSMRFTFARKGGDLCVQARLIRSGPRAPPRSSSGLQYADVDVRCAVR
jgi:hypothetical protein